ncbi:MAG: insulinase family protein [Gammaproteobacteria bacterium]
MFELLETRQLPSLEVNAKYYKHSKFGSTHLHFESKNSEKVFMVAFRTVPSDSSGVAHILEHTALCGSKKYPVRDPFFMMLRRSINSFMNAFTSTDWTAYPFATQNDKDFNNLLDVYIDSAFYPNLNKLDFLQEGHRLEFTEDGTGIFKGVVFNEMKGAMSGATDQLWHGISKHLFKGTTYENNSGGNPLDILNLSHSDLIRFHKTHYHPSNAIFFTFGDMQVKKIHTYLQQRVFSKHTPSPKKFIVQDVIKLSKPKLQKGKYQPSQGDSDGLHVTSSWLLGHSHDSYNLLEKYLMINILIDNSSSPLRKFLEKYKLAKAPTPLLGLEPSNKEIVFTAGFEGVTQANATKALEELHLEINAIAKKGIQKSAINNAIHQLELSKREINSGGMPMGLQIFLSCINAAIHFKNPLDMLDLDSNIDLLKKNLLQPKYIENLIREHLIDNPHRIDFLMEPDKKFNYKLDQALFNLAQIKAKNLSPAEHTKLAKLSQQLNKRQSDFSDPNLLPKVTKKDLPKKLVNKSERVLINKKEIYKIASNNLNYISYFFGFRKLNPSDFYLVNPLAYLITNLGYGNKNAEAAQAYQAKLCSGVDASVTTLKNYSAQVPFNLALSLSTKMLPENTPETLKLIHDIITQAKQTDKERIQNLLQMYLLREEEHLNQNGHIMAMNSAAATLNPYAWSQENLYGISALKNLKDIYLREQGIEGAIQALKSLYGKILLIPQGIFKAGTTINSFQSPKREKITNQLKFNQKGLRQPLVNRGWIINSQICYNSIAFKGVPIEHQNAPMLALAGAMLRNGFLHTEIREKGGAYGAGAQHDSSSESFKFYSYRDPSCSKTIDTFLQAKNWLNKYAKKRHLDEAVLNIVSSIDKPLTPLAAAKTDFLQRYSGTSLREKNKYRKKIIEAKLVDVIDASLELFEQDYSITSIGGEKFISEMEKENLKIYEF